MKEAIKESGLLLVSVIYPNYPSMLNTEIKIDQAAEVSFANTMKHLQLANIPFEVKTEPKSTLIIVRRVESLES